MAKDVKVSALLPLAQKALNEKWGYIWGGYGQIHTQKAQDSATREQTKKWGQQWVGKHVLDCSGLFYWAYNENGGYMYHGCNTMWNKYATSKGKLVKGKRDDGKDLKPGTAVFLVNGTDRHHVGMYIGGGYVIEAKGTYYGVVKSSVKVWDEWAELKTTVYDVEEGGSAASSASSSASSATSTAAAQNVGKSISVTLNTLKNGSSGEQVKTVQRILNGSGYTSGTVDGKYGKNTENAVKAFQKAKGLTADGICGLNTWNALLGA